MLEPYHTELRYDLNTEAQTNFYNLYTTLVHSRYVFLVLRFLYRYTKIPPAFTNSNIDIKTIL